MCGIAGLYESDFGADRLAVLKRMLARIEYRGPDEMGYYIDDRAALGTARLSIVDAAGGSQPLADASERYWIAFNGEIYNYRELGAQLRSLGHRFATAADTEVALYAWIAWGSSALARFNGPFALAIYDRLSGSLMLARDRFGKRPLYYSRLVGAIAFASEMKCLLECAPLDFQFDVQQLASIFRTWTPIDAQSGFKSVLQVPAGTFLTVNGRSTELHSYTTLTFGGAEPGLEEQEGKERVYQALRASVQRRVCADHDVGVYISGGLDSAIIARLVAEHARGSIKSFSIAFEDSELDESDEQRAIASFLGCDHRTLVIGDSEIVETFPQALWHAEVPVFRTAFVPMFLLSRLVRDRGLKVVLTGEGADEVFLGYDIFKETLLRQAWSHIEAPARLARLRLLYPYLKHFGPENQAALYGYFEQFARRPDTQLFSHELRFQGSGLATRLLHPQGGGLRPLLDSIAAAGERYEGYSGIQRAQWLEFKTLLGGYLLSTQGDRMALAHGVENRCPFLDSDVVALGGAVNLRFDDGFNEKYILKRAFAGELPAWVLSRNKQPYRAPDAAPFLRHKPAYLEKIQSESELRKIEVLDSRSCAAFVARVSAKPVQDITPAENQAFLFLLSTALLHGQFCCRGVMLDRSEKQFARCVDRRTNGSSAVE